MKFIPILFSTPMVQAILGGRKTMTRRAIKGLKIEENQFNRGKINFDFKKGNNYSGGSNVEFKDLSDDFLGITSHCPYGRIGDVLWVRETCLYNDGSLPTDVGYVYKAELGPGELEYSRELNVKWKPSIFMPKTACRIFLEITSIKVERLRDINPEDAVKEGISWNKGPVQSGFGINNSTSHVSAIACFEELWRKINGAESWEANPFVWCVSFKRIDKPDNF